MGVTGSALVLLLHAAVDSSFMNQPWSSCS